MRPSDIVWSVSAAPAVGAASTDYSGSGRSVWQVWLNGVLLNWAANVNNGGSTYPSSINTPVQGAGYPQAMARPLSYLGQGRTSVRMLRWTWRISIDAFRIYNYTLSTASVQALASIYGLNLTNPQWPIPSNQPLPAVLETALYTGVTAQAPVFNGVFGQSPAPFVGGATSYTWLQVDPTDNVTVQGHHSGIVVLNTSTSLIDVTTVTGPNSVGLALPVICTGNTGCTVEMVVKLTQAQSWNKLINFGTGQRQQQQQQQHNQQPHVARHLSVDPSLTPSPCLSVSLCCPAAVCVCLLAVPVSPCPRVPVPQAATATLS